MNGAPRLWPRLSLLAAALLIAGCATPLPVLQLADKTSANVGVVSARLQQLADESERVYAARVNNIANLHAANATQRAALAYDIALTRRAGQQGDLALMQDLQSWSKEVDEIYAEAAAADVRRREALMGEQARIDIRAAALNKVAERLAALATQETASERARLLGRFAREVRDAAKKQLDDGSASAQQAKALLDRLRGSFSAASPQ